MEYFGYLAAVLIGIILGLIGGGGSILAVPILVYLFHISPEKATSYSLFIVGITAMVGTGKHYQLNNLKVKSALFFAIPSILSLLLVRKLLLPILPATLFTIGDLTVTKDMFIMLVFALLMVSASVSMILKTSGKAIPAQVNYSRLVVIGFLVGSITGFLGAGGGFLIIPALLFFAHLEMKQAVGTSLLIIFVNSLLGFAADVWGSQVVIDYGLLFTITTIAVLGMFIGTFLSRKIDNNHLKPIFGWFVLMMGFYIIFKEIVNG